jgi:hypothetical protein
VLPHRGVEAASDHSEATVTTIVPKLKVISLNKMYKKLHNLKIIN